jgi:hypothetical protein
MKRIFNTRWGYLPRGSENLSSVPDRWWIGPRGATSSGLWARRWGRVFREVIRARH